MTQTEPVTQIGDERMSCGQCPNCGCLPNRHDNWGGPDGCELTAYGVAVQQAKYECRHRAEVDSEGPS